jgi:diguanylate cyclase (GGDEF)-like protein
VLRIQRGPDERLVAVKALSDRRGPASVAVLLSQETAESRQRREALREQATHDALTGLFNRRYLDETLPRELHRHQRSGEPMVVAMLDLDHFKRFNDTYGHQAGDKVLHAIADLFKKNTRKSNVVARYGFEKFSVILPECSRDEVLVFAERIRTLIAEYPFADREKQPGVDITASIGVATFPHDGIERKALIDHADQSLTIAKNSGSNRVC